LVTVISNLIPIFEKNGFNITLDVYSGLTLYNREDLDKQFKYLYDFISNHKNMRNHGIVSNSQIREELKKAHIFAYPSIFPETSCLCLIEALSAGCLCVHSDYGALPETSGGHSFIYEYCDDVSKHMDRFAEKLIHCIKFLESEYYTLKIENQTEYVVNTFNIENILEQWKNIIKV
jgi:glycosyltransferase involved in cell wall biosynthesis